MLKDVQERAAQPARRQRLDQRGFVDDMAARHVDDRCMRGQGGQRAAVDQAARGRCQRTGQHQPVCLGQQPGQFVIRSGVARLGHGRGGMAHHGERQAQRAQQGADALADGAPAHHHRVLARQVARRARAQQRSPCARALVGRQQGQAARQGQHTADGGLRHHGVGRALRRGDGHAARVQVLIDLAVSAGRMHVHPLQRGRIAHGVVIQRRVGRDLELGRFTRDVARHKSYLRIAGLAGLRMAQREAPPVAGGQRLAQCVRLGR
ncbi:hypothetical protein D3C72_1344550 [compost metagenome]